MSALGTLKQPQSGTGQNPWWSCRPFGPDTGPTSRPGEHERKSVPTNRHLWCYPTQRNFVQLTTQPAGIHIDNDSNKGTLVACIGKAHSGWAEVRQASGTQGITTQGEPSCLHS